MAHRRRAVALLLLLARCADAQPYVDPPFDLTRVVFSAVFSDDMVLQRAPQQSTVFGTATPGATVTVSVSGPAEYSWSSAPAPVARSPDVSVDGTWKVLLPARPAGFGYNVSAVCGGCPNATAVGVAGVGFGDVSVTCMRARRVPACARFANLSLLARTPPPHAGLPRERSVQHGVPSPHDSLPL